MMCTTTQTFITVILHTFCMSRMFTHIAPIMQTQAHTTQTTTTVDTIQTTIITMRIQRSLLMQAEQADPLGLAELVRQHSRGEPASVAVPVEVAL